MIIQVEIRFCTFIRPVLLLEFLKSIILKLRSVNLLVSQMPVDVWSRNIR